MILLMLIFSSIAPAAVKVDQVKKYLSSVYKKAQTYSRMTADLPAGSSDRVFAEKAVAAIKNEVKNLSAYASDETSAKSQNGMKSMVGRVKKLEAALDKKIAERSKPSASAKPEAGPRDLQKEINTYQDKIRQLEAELQKEKAVELSPQDSVLFYLDRGEGKRALALAGRLIVRTPSNPELHYLKAKAHRLIGDLGAARQSMREALRLQTANSVYWETLGGIQSDLGDKRAALSALNEALSINPGNWDARLTIADILFESGDPDSAEAIYKKAEKVQVLPFRTFRGLGNIAYRNLNYERAKTYYIKALDIQPDDGEILLALANSYMAANQFNYAAEFFQRLLLLQPEQQEARFSLGRIAFESGDYSKAMYHWELLYARNEKYPDILYWLPAVYFVHGEYLAQKGQNREATRLYQKALALNPDSQRWLAQANFKLGDDYRRLRNYTTAEKYLKKALEIDPRSLESAFALGMMHWDLKDYNGAKSYWNYVLSIDPDNRDAKSWLRLLPSDNTPQE